MKKYLLFFTAFLLLWSCSKDYAPVIPTEWMERESGFQQKYELEELVVLSRHNIRTPMVGKGSVLTRLTDPAYQWHQWTEPASHLTDKGERLEARMGTFFREWLSKKSFLDDYTANKLTFRFYANAKQRCQLTARTFADALFPGEKPEVEMKVTFDTMDPVFNPQITKLPEGFADKAQKEIAARFGDLNKHIAAQYAVL